MRIETKYFAWDESEFDTEEECLAYEKGLEDMWSGVVLIDEEYRTQVDAQMPAHDFLEGFALYIKVLDVEKAKEMINWVTEYSGVSVPPVDMIYENGLFKFDEDAQDEWVDLYERLREVTLEVESVEKKVNSLG